MNPRVRDNAPDTTITESAKQAARASFVDRWGIRIPSGHSRAIYRVAIIVINLRANVFRSQRQTVRRLEAYTSHHDATPRSSDTRCQHQQNDPPLISTYEVWLGETRTQGSSHCA
jgi:hypothetical protein